MSAEARAVVVGAGIGGLVAALRLAAHGVAVTVCESADAPGGKLRPLSLAGLPIDGGPTVFTMRWVFDELFDEIGTSTAAVLPPLVPLQVLARHAWARDGSRLDLLADRGASADAIGRFAGAAEARRYLAFCREAERVYRTLEPPHIRSSRPSVPQMIRDLGPQGLAALTRLGPLTTLASLLARRFEDPRLRQLFARYATYCGASPWRAPATLMLVAHVEQQGVWAVEGGMGAVAGALVAELRRRGGVLRCGARVRRLLRAGGDGAVQAVELDGGERLPADAVVYNGDIAALPALLHGGEPPLAGAAGGPARSLSALTWALRTRAAGFGLARHNVFFDDDYASEFDDVFARRRLPRHGTVYVCAQDRVDDGPPQAASASVDGRERLLVLVNAPALGAGAAVDDDQREIEACERRSRALLQRCGLALEEVPGPPGTASIRRTPATFARLFPGSAGALYGPATHGWMALFRRAGATTPVPGLVTAGGSVHPGPGVPMAAMSGRLAAATLMAHLASTRRSARVRISGGTSMPSATTAAMR